MSENASERGQERSNGSNESQYLVDDTVTLGSDESYKKWDLDIDPESSKRYVIRAIGRSENTRVRAYVVPEEEVQFFEDDETIWWEFRSRHDEKVSQDLSLSGDDQDPYEHDGDYVLLVEATGSNEPKISVKFGEK
ncbi:hypothetical protein [Haloarcula sp. JP-L23]|uniref:hypothetical protein n=1 Tax=Haloarcula sp. JP-L23 TaxID=2716717 RepID=UPI00140F353A|nr:hypothetical protein G9465_24935 [Haloarcula sp. JP-L23]